MGGNRYKSRADKRRSKKSRKGFQKKKIVVDEGNATIVDAAGVVDTDPSYDAEVPADFTVDNDDLSLSSRKLKRKIDESINAAYDYGDEGTLFMNISLFLDTMRRISCCPNCVVKTPLSIDHDLSRKAGLAHFFNLICSVCGWQEQFCSSRVVNSKRGQPSYEINNMSVIAFRENGLGHSAMENFCGMMNMPPPMTKAAYQKSMSKIADVYKHVAADSMKQAAAEVKGIADVVDTTASFDGTWQKRGHVSFNGVITAMSLNGKCIDYEVKSKVCKACQFWTSKIGSEEYNQWKENHVCSNNHDGSAGKMEMEGVVEMFKRSVEKNGLRYTTYLGDGDTKSFAQVNELRPYGEDVVIQKAECVGHIQKRVGTRLRDLKVRYRGKKLEDGKTLGGVGRLNEKTINTLQNYYGMAIRQNKNDLYGMKKSVAAVLHHCSEAQSDEVRHQFCPRSEDSWCKFQSNKLTGEHTYKSKISIPPAIFKILKDMFSHKDLGSDELLSRCLHGRTQNPNECINNTIWSRCPKRVYVGLQTMEMGVCSAVISFNDGGLGLLPLFDNLEITRGNYRLNFLQKKDADRLSIMSKKWEDEGKQRRSKLRSIRKKYVVADTSKEGETYSKGCY